MLCKYKNGLFEQLPTDLHSLVLKLRNGYYIYLITIFLNYTLIIISYDDKVAAF